MARIPKTKVYNPQKAEAYVGKRVLQKGDTIPAIKGSITPVPNGHLIKKDGTALKNGDAHDSNAPACCSTRVENAASNSFSLLARTMTN